MGFWSSIGHAFKKVGHVVKKVAGGLVKGTLGMVLKPFSKVLGVLGKIPFVGSLLGKVLPFLSKLGPLAFLAGGPLGMALGLMSKVGTLGGLANLVGGFVKSGGGVENMLPEGIFNLADGSAWRHAQLLRFF